MYVDVNAHLEDKAFDEDRDKVLERSKEVRIVNCGTHPASNRFILNFVNKYENVFGAFGIYPLAAVADELGDDYPNDFGEFDIDKELKWIDQNIGGKIVALGEIGLDHEFHDDRKRVQEDTFRKQLRLAKKHNVPVIVHSRKAERRVIEIMEEENVKKGILHFFSGSKKLIQRAEADGFYFSIPANIERSTQFQMIAKEVSVNKLLTETDCPYGAPVRGDRNEPANVKLTVREIAKIKGLTEAETKMIIFKNFNDLF